MSELRIVLPKTVRDEVSDGLRALTRRLMEINPDSTNGFGLGGPDGYGVAFQNDVFTMHPFCWCESDSCAWCGHHAPNFHHVASSSSAWWYKWIGRDQRALLALPWADILSDCFASLEQLP